MVSINRVILKVRWGGGGGGWGWGGGGHNKVTFGASYNFIGRMGGWELGWESIQTLSIEQGVPWYEMIFCDFLVFTAAKD